MSMSNRIAVLAIVGSSLAAHAAAADSDVEVNLRVVPQRDGAPQIEATLIGAPTLPMDHYRLRADTGASVPAIALRDFRHGPDTVAIAFVVCGWEVWMGNDHLLPEDDASRYPGVLEGLEHALDALHLDTIAPDGSLGAVITYATKPEVRVPMGPLSRITGAALGSQKDYYGTVGNEMVSGIEVALAELHKAPAATKVLIVLGDGNDTNNDAARVQLRELKKQAAREGIRTFAITYKSVLSDEGNVITTMVPSARMVNSADGIAAALGNIVTRMSDRMYLTFPGYDPTTRAALPWNGERHELVVQLGAEDTDSVMLDLAPTWQPPGPSRMPQLLSTLLALLALGLCFVGMPMLERR